MDGVGKERERKRAGGERRGAEEEGGRYLGARHKELEERHTERDQEAFHMGS